MASGVIDGSLLSQAHPVLDFGESLFNRVEVGEYGGRYQSRAPAFFLYLVAAGGGPFSVDALTKRKQAAA
ncbi:hypothetical protein FHX09_000906 [Rhizobium sp. BK538]|nr:hypothetical protein [Rhizobium sp. BK060]MBB4167082.1 hypothetical protein [Rhizobium sp. BK538]